MVQMAMRDQQGVDSVLIQIGAEIFEQAIRMSAGSRVDQHNASGSPQGIDVAVPKPRNSKLPAPDKCQAWGYSHGLTCETLIGPSSESALDNITQIGYSVDCRQIIQSACGARAVHLGRRWRASNVLGGATCEKPRHGASLIPDCKLARAPPSNGARSGFGCLRVKHLLCGDALLLFWCREDCRWIRLRNFQAGVRRRRVFMEKFESRQANSPRHPQHERNELLTLKRAVVFSSDFRDSLIRKLMSLNPAYLQTKGLKSNSTRWVCPINLVLVLYILAAFPIFAKLRVSSPSATSNDSVPPPTIVAQFERSPKIVLLPDGTLMGLRLETAGAIQELKAGYSRDDGRSWTEFQILLDLPQGEGSWSGPEALVDRHGELQLFLINARILVKNPGEADRPHIGPLHGRRLDLWHVRSTLGRKHWEGPKLVWKGYTGSLNSFVQLRSGRLLLPFSFVTDRTWRHRGGGFDDFTFMGQFDSTVLYSDDSGATWRLSPSHLEVPVPDIVSAYGGVEPVVLQLRDGRVWMLIRTQMGRLYESFSDDGVRWSEAQPTSIISSDSPAGLVRLRDGRILLCWNECLRYPYAHGGRQVLHAAISADEGRTWCGYREVVRDPLRNEPPPSDGDFGTAYPFPTLTADGKVLIHTGQGKGRNVLILLDPQWLYETHQRADFVQGLEDWSVFGTRGVELVPDTDKPATRVLSLRKTEVDWPAGAVWNFPSGLKGRLELNLMLKSGFQGLLLGLTDHFSPPFDQEDQYFNLFNLPIKAAFTLPNGTRIEPGRWHSVDLIWDCANLECRVILDGQEVASLPLRRETTGVSYVRLRSTAKQTDQAGLLLRSAEVDVVPSGSE
jgi:BNR repeat-like domain